MALKAQFTPNQKKVFFFLPVMLFIHLAHFCVSFVDIQNSTAMSLSRNPDPDYSG